MSVPAISFSRVTRRYGPVLGLNDLSLEVGGGITGLIGPNGAGKTTFLNLAVGMLRPSSGTVQVLGTDLWTDVEARGRMGYCPDGERLFEWATGRQFVVSLGVYAGLAEAEAGRRADEALARLEMTAAAGKQVREYSKGMRQKVKLAQAMIHEPDLMVLDEPLNGVDPVSRIQIVRELSAMAKRGAAIVVSSHVLHELEAIVDQVVLLHHGRLLASGTVESIRDLLDEHPRTVRLRTPDPRGLGRELLGVAGVVSADLGVEETLDVRTRDPAALYAALPGAVLDGGFQIDEVASPDGGLEAVFRYLTRGGAS